MAYCIEVSFATKGKRGRKNQDNFMIDKFVACASQLQSFGGYIETDTLEKRLFVVSDGAGGCAQGEVASEITVGTLFEKLDNIKSQDTQTAMKRALDGANHSVVSFYHGAEDSGVATVSGLLFEEDFMWFFNAGDSPIYLICDGVMERISQEHTLSGRHGRGKKTVEDNTLTRYMGDPAMAGSELVYSGKTPVSDGMILIIASDGIEKGLSEKAIKKLAVKKGNYIAQELVKKAEKNGASDDITAIVIKVSGKKSVTEGM